MIVTLGTTSRHCRVSEMDLAFAQGRHECDAPNRGSGTHGRHRRRGFRPRIPQHHRLAKNHRRRHPDIPHEPLQWGIDALAATPSGWANRTGQLFATCVTLARARAEAQRPMALTHATTEACVATGAPNSATMS